SRVGDREGDARPPDAADGRPLSALRLLVARRIHHSGALGDRPAARAVANPSPLLARTVLCGTRASSGLVGTTAYAATASSARTSGSAATSWTSSCGADARSRSAK